MDRTTPSLRPPRLAVLILSHGDGYLEIFGDGIDVHLARVPLVGTAEGELLAENWIDATIPPAVQAVVLAGQGGENGKHSTAAAHFAARLSRHPRRNQIAQHAG